VTVGEFAEAVAKMRRRHRGWITSWGRTDAHAISVVGFAGDPHTWDRGADMLYEDGPPPLDALREEAGALGLKVLRETGKPHDHYQPLDFPAGPVTTYHGETRTLEATA